MSFIRAAILATVALAPLSGRLLAEPTPAANAAFQSYAVSVELRLARQHASAQEFLVPRTPVAGQPVIENLSPASHDLPGAMLHHWRGTAFAPGATAASFESLLRNLPAYPQIFAPEVTAARRLNASTRTSTSLAGKPAGDSVTAYLRLRQHHVLTVVLDSTYEITFARLDLRHGSSFSRSTNIAEIASAGTSAEHPLAPAEEHGFLWRLNTYWSWEERPEGLYIQVETISLTRSIPPGLGWAVRPFIESIPRESLEFTLRSACNALRK